MFCWASILSDDCQTHLYTWSWCYRTSGNCWMAGTTSSIKAILPSPSFSFFFLDSSSFWLNYPLLLVVLILCLSTVSFLFCFLLIRISFCPLHLSRHLLRLSSRAFLITHSFSVFAFHSSFKNWNLWRPESNYISNVHLGSDSMLLPDVFQQYLPNFKLSWSLQPNMLVVDMEKFISPQPGTLHSKHNTQLGAVAKWNSLKNVQS